MLQIIKRCMSGILYLSLDSSLEVSDWSVRAEFFIVVVNLWNSLICCCDYDDF